MSSRRADRTWFGKGRAATEGFEGSGISFPNPTTAKPRGGVCRRRGGKKTKKCCWVPPNVQMSAVGRGGTPKVVSVSRKGGCGKDAKTEVPVKIKNTTENQETNSWVNNCVITGCGDTCCTLGGLVSKIEKKKHTQLKIGGKRERKMPKKARRNQKLATHYGKLSGSGVWQQKCR